MSKRTWILKSFKFLGMFFWVSKWMVHSWTPEKPPKGYCAGRFSRLQGPPQVHPKRRITWWLVWFGTQFPTKKCPLRPQLAVSTLSCLLSLRIGHRSVTVSCNVWWSEQLTIFWGTTPFPYFPTPFLQSFASSKRPRRHFSRRDRAQPFSGGNGLRLDPKWFHTFNKV